MWADKRLLAPNVVGAPFGKPCRKEVTYLAARETGQVFSKRRLIRTFKFLALGYLFVDRTNLLAQPLKEMEAGNEERSATERDRCIPGIQ